MSPRSVVILVYFAFCSTQVAQAQELITSTPVRIQIPDQAAPAVEILSTPTITRTPTAAAVMLTAKESAGEVNVRAEPDVESDRLGSIRAGEFYPVLGRYFRWIQFQFETSPTGRGWVFDELVDVTGDASTIPDLSQQALPTQDPAIVAATQTQDTVTQTPGGILTTTAEARILSLPGADTSVIVTNETGAQVLPTFTYPPDIVAAAPTLATEINTSSPETLPFEVPNNVPPILPILALGAGGLLGLVVSSLRR
jgi:uncharacterized protein YgiM (DUF1202 family)